MSAVLNTPSNRNFLSPLNFRFSIKRSPNLNFHVQKVNIPTISLPPINIPTPFVHIPTEQSTVQYGNLSVTFKVDEDFQNYMEIHSWMRSLGFPDNYREYADLSAIPAITGESTRSELSLIILNSAKNPNYEFTFRNAFPSGLSSVEFDTTQQDIDYVTATVEFQYIMFDVKKIS